MQSPLSRFKPLLLAAALLCAAATAQAPGDVRIALVIGNSAYAGPLALQNPANDAKAMGQVLRGLGFNVVEVLDGSKAQMTQALATVQGSLQGKQAVGMLYYAGHGLQVDARNFMVPVDAKMSKAADVAPQTVDVASVIDAFKTAGNRMNIVVLDACRDNPFGGITTGKGLAPLDAPSGTFLAYATAPGNVAEDGDVNSGNGLYTQFLLQELRKPQARIEEVFKRVRFNVRQKSNGRQIPWESTSLEDDFYFNDGRIVTAAKPQTQALLDSFAEEKKLWEGIRDSRNPDDFYAFLQKYPNGTITEAATARLNQLTRPALVVQGGDASGSDQVYATRHFRAGERYVTQVDQLSNGTSQKITRTERVVRVTAEEMAVEYRNEYADGNAPSTVTRLYDADGGFKAIQGYVRFSPAYYEVPSGLYQVGRNWKIAFDALREEAKGVPSQARTGTARIVARETIATPAGSFATFRIDSETVVRSSNGATTTTRTRQWRAPDIPVPIKEDYESETAMSGVTVRMSHHAELLRLDRAP
jgi:uncharacterized caspase-like protein